MRTLHDALGLDLSTGSADAAAAWDRLTEEVLAHGRGAAAALAETLMADPTLAAAHAVRGLMLLGLARAELVAPARLAHAEARRLMRAGSVAPREAAFADALGHWLEGRPLQAAAVLEGGLRDRPHDILAFKFAHAIRFMAGDLTGMQAAARRWAPGFAGSALHGFALGCHAFAEEEAGDMAAAERLARHALAIAPRDAWGRHALAHVFEATGRAEEGARWLNRCAEGWSHCGNFSYHMYWHLALFELELGRPSAALALYDLEIRAERTDDYRDLANGASLLARLELEGVDVGGRWEELAEIAARRAADRRLVFADLHYLLALTADGRGAEAGALLGRLCRDARSDATHDAHVARKAGVAAAAGVSAFRGGAFPRAARLFGEALPALAAIGGSHAQRDLFEQFAIEATIRSGDLPRAAVMLEDRLARRGGRNLFAARRLAAIGRTTRPRGDARIDLRLGALAIATATPAHAH